MRVVVIGSEGFIGQALVEQLRVGAPVGESGQIATLITRVDQIFTSPDTNENVRSVQGDICDPIVLDRAFAGGVDCVFHLASIPGGAAEANFELGLKVNLQATISLLEALRLTGHNPTLVFASTIGVYGVPMPAVIDESTIPAPSLSYGAHKYIGEVLVNDYGRRGFVDGRAVRIPGIVARPPSKGMRSIFLSDLIRELSQGRSFTCPVSPEGMSWWMSRPCVVDNLLHAARLPQNVLARQRTFLLPVLRLTIDEVVRGIAAIHGDAILRRIRYQPDPELQSQFANYPPLNCTRAEDAGFRNDGDVATLIRRALERPL